MDDSRRPVPPHDEHDQPGEGPGGNWRHGMLLGLLAAATVAIIVVVAMFSGRSTDTQPPNPVDLTYSDLIAKVDADEVSRVVIRSDGYLTGALRSGTAFTSRIPTAAPDDTLTDRLLAHGVTVTAEPAPTGSGWGVLASLLPWVLPLALILFFLRRSSRGPTGAATFGRAPAQLVDPAQPSTTFAEIAGYEGVKEEIHEVVDYLRRPERYHEAGAQGPGGVLMVGPPGTGKTLFARAIAGEAGVPFFSVTASSFVELYVGVGASRVRDLFRRAREKAPAIIFIDEIDAIGQVRNPGRLSSNDEREQTLNQLLAEMDGFDPSKGVVVLAATNRPDTLDPALLRPGRFDRRVVIPLPNQGERRAILAVHCRDKQLGPDVDLATVARATPGFSGADLANLANEAAIVAVRDRRVVVSAADFESARDRIVLGRRDQGNVLLADERALVALHEAGHALVAALSPHADPVSKVSILPTGEALGVTHQLPVDERHLYTEPYLAEALAVRLAGRAAEQLVRGERSSGAADDLASATYLAVRMVRELGLSDELGPVAYPSPEQSAQPLTVADETQRAIDRAVAALLTRAEERASAMLQAHRRELEELAAVLEQREVLDGTEIYDILHLERGPRTADRPDGPVASGDERAVSAGVDAEQSAVEGATQGNGSATGTTRPSSVPAASAS